MAADFLDELATIDEGAADGGDFITHLAEGNDAAITAGARDPEPTYAPYRGNVAPLSPMNPLGPIRAAADVAVSGARGLVNHSATTLAGVWGALSPNDTYEAAKAREREAIDRDEGIVKHEGTRTPEGHALEQGLGQMIRYTGIPYVLDKAGNYIESVGGPMARDIAASAAELLTLRGAGGSAATGESAAREGVRLGSDAGAASAAVDLSKVRPALRKAIEDAAAVDGVHPEAAARQLNADALGVESLTKGQATRDEILWSKERNDRLIDKRAAEKFTRQSDSAVEKLDDLLREVSPNVAHQDAIQNGQTLIDAYKEYDVGVRADIKTKYQALTDANGGDLPIDGQAFVANADAALKKSRKGHFLPNEIRSLMDEFKEGPMTFDDFETLRTTLSTAGRGAKDGNVRAAIGTVREALESLPLKGAVADKLKPLADQARGAAKARFDRLEADPAYSSAAEDFDAGVKVGQASALADDFVQKHVVRGRAANLQRMRETLANDKTATETIAAGALNYLRERSGGAKGKISQDTYNTILRKELAPKIQSLVPTEISEQLQMLGDYLHDFQKPPDGAGVNYSNTAVAQAASAATKYAKGAAEFAVNAKAGGIPVGTAARNWWERRAESKWLDESLAPGAGVRLDKVLKNRKRPNVKR